MVSNYIVNCVTLSTHIYIIIIRTTSEKKKATMEKSIIFRQANNYTITITTFESQIFTNKISLL